MSAFELSREQMRAAVGLLQQYFFSREDVLATRSPGGNPRPGKGKLIPLLSAHVAGEVAPAATVRYETRRGIGAESGYFRIGSYCLNPESNVRWLCLDFDGGADHAASLEDPLGAALATQEAFAARGVPGYLERSGGGQGWHVWVFFAVPVPAVKARRLAFALVPRGWLKTDGTPAEPESGRGIEIFPKQDRIGKKGFGNLVWLPWWHGAAEGGNQFVRIAEETGTLECWFPAEGFQTVTAEQLDAVLAQLPAAVPSASPGSGAAPSPVYTPGDHRQSLPVSPQTNPDPAWESWRAEALSRLRVEDIYGEWLTGESSSLGWLQCRDPWSASGDKNPSAGVADGTGTAERGTFHSFISGKSLSPFDFLVTMGRASSFSDALRQVAQMTGTPAPSQSAEPDGPPIEFDLPVGREDAPTGEVPQNSQSSGQPIAINQPGKVPSHTAPRAPSPPADRLPEIVTNGRQLTDLLKDYWNVIHAQNTMGQPFLFERGAQLVRLRKVRETNTLTIDHLDDAAMFGILAQRARWIKVTQEGAIASAPSKDVAHMMVDNPDPRMPILQSVVTTPCYGKSGTLIRRRGYHASDHLWFEPMDNLGDLPIPDEPSAEDVAGARAMLLDDLAVDFPFASDSDRAHFIAALLLPFTRRMIAGCTPLHVFEAPSVGSGKSLLCATIAMIATGADLPTSSIPEHDDEVRKLITSKLLAGAPIMLLDNAREKKLFDCPILAAALTATTWNDRLLGTNKAVSLSNTQAWFLTGNNPRLSMELLRRTVRIRLDPKRDRAWQRDGFKHDPLLEWVRANRADLVRACLTIIQAWVAAGKPRGKARLGSFEDWAATMGGILEVGGIDGFLTNLDEVYENADNESDEWRAFVGVWWDQHRGQPKKVSELLELCRQHELMAGVRGTVTEAGQKVRLGRALSAARQRVFGTLRIEVEMDGKSKVQTYRLTRVDDGAPRPKPRSTSDLFDSLPDAPNGSNGHVVTTGAASNGSSHRVVTRNGSAGDVLAGDVGIPRQSPANQSEVSSHSNSTLHISPAGDAGDAGDVYGSAGVCVPAQADINHIGSMDIQASYSRACVHTCEVAPKHPPHPPPSYVENCDEETYTGGGSRFESPSEPRIPRHSPPGASTGSEEGNPPGGLPDLADFDAWDEGDDDALTSEPEEPDDGPGAFTWPDPWDLGPDNSSPGAWEDPPS